MHYERLNELNMSLSSHASLLANTCHLIRKPKILKTTFKLKEWVTAMKEEQSLHNSHTWMLVPHPIDVNMVGSKWIYRIKFEKDGSLDRYKTKLVVKGFTQVEGLDYEETFTVVVKLATIRLIISVALMSKVTNKTA